MLGVQRKREVFFVKNLIQSVSDGGHQCHEFAQEGCCDGGRGSGDFGRSVATFLDRCSTINDRHDTACG